jgi:hypothetical protein
MTTIDFLPNITQAFQFQATLDGSSYNCLVTWNLAGQRFYVSCYDLSGNLVFSLPLIGSPSFYDINIAGGYFTTSTLVYRIANKQIIITP